MQRRGKFRMIVYSVLPLELATANTIPVDLTSVPIANTEVVGFAIDSRAKS